MKVSCLQVALREGLGVVSRAVAARSTLPILGHVLLETDGDRLKLSATNLEIGVRCWVGAMVHEEGAATVPAALLDNFVHELPEERVDLDLDARTQTLHLQCARHHAHIEGLDAQDFPLIPAINTDQAILVDPAVLRQMIGQATIAAASEDSRPILTSVLTTGEKDHLTLAAADGFRLSECSTTLGQRTDRRLAAIIPARALSELARLLGGAKDPVRVVVENNQVVPSTSLRASFRLETAELVSRLIEGNFPNYRQVIPTRYDTRVQMSTAELLKAVRLAALFARDAAIRLDLVLDEDLAPGHVTVTAGAEAVGDHAGEVAAAIAGPATAIAFNYKYLADVLGVVGTAEVALELTTPAAPVVVRPVGQDSFRHVLMPMQIAPA